MVQANSLADSLNASFGIAPEAVGLALAAVTGLVILGGVRRIGEVAQVLVPFMTVVYLAGGTTIFCCSTSVSFRPRSV